MAGEERSKLPSDLRRFFTGRGAGQSRLQPAPAEVLCTQGDPGDALFYIEKGWVKISLVSAGGKEAVIALRGAGEFFGTRCLVEPHRRLATVTTLTNCSLVRMTRTAVTRLLREEPDFAELFAVSLVLQDVRDKQRLIDQLTNSSEMRLARTLLGLTNNAGGDKPRLISARVNQADLANMIGTTRSRVSHFMNKFRRQGFIEYNRRGYVTVHKALSKALLDT